MRTKPTAALAGPLAALLALGALGAYTSLSHLKGLSTREQALIFVVIAVLGAVLGVVGASRLGGREPSSLVELSEKTEQFATRDVPAAVEATLASPTGQPAELPKLPELFKTASGTSQDLVGLARSIEALGATAVELAARQAGLRANLAEAFVNLGRRNQNLVTRQLEYISELEQNEAEPQALDELFRLDHLATRMRRNAESLLVLAGASPARQWDAPVAAMDIARAASAEVEDYKRLRLHHFDPALVSGSATTDLVHILAELVENALTYSPPGSPVDIYGRFLEGGYVIVIVDAGIGMPPEDLETANRRLKGEGAEGEVPGRYLGHFVAGSLGARHSVAISLQPSQSGGLVARVKIPSTIVQEPGADLPAMPNARPAPDFLGTSAYAAAPGQGPTPAPVGGSLPHRPAPEPSMTSFVAAQPFAVDEAEPASKAAPYEPATYEPDQDGPATHEPAQYEPATHEPAQYEPATHEPATYEPATYEPATYEPSQHEPATYEPSQHEPSQHEPAQYEPAQYEPAQYDGLGLIGAAETPDVFDRGLRPSIGTEPRSNGTATPGPEAPVAPFASSGPDGQGTAGPGQGLGPAIGDEPGARSPAEPENDVPVEQFGRAWDPIAKLGAAGAPATPDLGMLSPLAGLVQRRPLNGSDGAVTEVDDAKQLHPSSPRDLSSPERLTSRESGHLPAHAKRSPASAESDLHPAAQAKSTADALRRLTRRVPGAALAEEDGSLRRSSPESASLEPTGITGALSQYFSATAPTDLEPTVNGQNGTEHGPR